MPLSKKQMMYGGVLVIAAGAFFWDRAGAPPTPASANAASAPKPAEAPAAAAAKPAGPASPRMTVPNREAIFARLTSTAALRSVDPAQPANAFAVPATWLPEQAAVAKVTVDELLEAAKAFSTKHALNAVMVRSKTGYAIIDGQGVFVGQALDAFKLLAVTNNSATFGKEFVRVQLNLDGKPKFWREVAAGNASATHGNDAAHAD